MESNRTMKIVSFNCKSVHRSADCIRSLCEQADIICLQETWLLSHDIAFLGTIDDKFAYTGKSAVDTSTQVLRGRPNGGIALLWRKGVFTSVTPVKCNSVRLVAIKVVIEESSFLVFSVYMSTDSAGNLAEFTECLSEISAIVKCQSVESVFMLGDYNAQPGERFGCELFSFCRQQLWSCADIVKLSLDSNEYTYVSEAHENCRSWLDHCVVTEAAF